MRRSRPYITTRLVTDSDDRQHLIARGVDWTALGTADLGPLDGAQRRLLDLAVSLGGGIPVDLRSVVCTNSVTPTPAPSSLRSPGPSAWPTPCRSATPPPPCLPPAHPGTHPDGHRGRTATLGRGRWRSPRPDRRRRRAHPLRRGPDTTTRADSGAWEAFDTCCGTVGLAPLPADLVTVERYITLGAARKDLLVLSVNLDSA
ncbi:hypothetical protein [Nocardia sp. NPDC060259]|uniref:hypothetical protein n=1 Tax=Nocardia sp. NPDC060259 TaxID=3347088 RepID=UPI00364DF328